MIKKFITRFKELLYEELNKKTNWGRNDLKIVIELCIVQALLEVME